MQRWREEVILLDEEMRRTAESLEWSANQWESRKEVEGFSGARAEGARAYAAQQAAQFRSVGVRFQQEWSQQSNGKIRGQTGVAEEQVDNEEDNDEDNDLETPDEELLDAEDAEDD